MIFVFQLKSLVMQNSQRVRSTLEKSLRQNLRLFCELLSAADWSQLTASSQPNDAFDKLHLNLEECYNEAFPLCNSSFNKRYNAINPWMSKGLFINDVTQNWPLLDPPLPPCHPMSSFG